MSPYMGTLQITAQEARDWWRALMGNVVDLVEDAAVLLQNGSPGRARSLVVLASEELAKAIWLDQVAGEFWLVDDAAVLDVSREFTAARSQAHRSRTVCLGTSVFLE